MVAARMANVGRAISLMGVVCVAAALIVLLLLLIGTGSYFELTAENLRNLSVVIAQSHRETVLAQWTELQGQTFLSPFRATMAFEQAVQRAGTQLQGGIGDYETLIYVEAAMRAATQGLVQSRPLMLFLLTFGLVGIGGVAAYAPRLWLRAKGIQNNHVMFSSTKARGLLGMLLGALLIAFYIALYFYPAHITVLIQLADLPSHWIRGQPADRWFFYGLIYTLAIVVMAVRMAIHYRHSRYHLVRTASVTFFQVGFAFLIPSFMEALNRPGFDFKLAWPLDYSFFFGYRLDGYLAAGGLGWVLLLWGLAFSMLAIPAFAVLWGKRWYCSWVCGCGALAETVGDPFRHLSDKSLRAWRIERWMVHGVLVLVLLMTAIVLINYVSNGAYLGELTWRSQSLYGFLIGSVFAGVVGTGFYPLMGNRVWCRFGCPLAAILGLVQRFRSRFRITTNGGQCISCGNCSTYCEMGIDVRWYAQRGQNIVRASCVGCGICAAVCPRGVLRLENGPLEGRTGQGLVQICRH